MGKLLDNINQVNDIKRIPEKYYPALAREIREFLLLHVSKTGGHLASNLGIVEITMALHICLDMTTDKVVFDVGHQSYIHKLLTGRKEEFDTLRQKGGMCGFPKRKESPYDVFGTGHSSTSLSAALGFAMARSVKKSSETVCAVIGDGALSGGLAYEALNNISALKKKKENLIIILNDNKMSIAENVGGMSRYLSDLRTRKEYGDFKNNVETALNNIPAVGASVARTLKRSKDSIKQLFVPGMLFENMDITYYGPVDGHNVHAMVHAINMAKKHPGPILIHAITKKGKGYAPAETNPEHFHGLGAFDVETGLPLNIKIKESYTDVFSRSLIELAKKDQSILAITAAMPSGTGLSEFKKLYPDRFFDVGIAEEHAVTFAAGMAAAGLKPVFAVYSSFLQRAYDQVLHDVCIQNLPVVFCIDRSGLVGADGETHQGIFDISYLAHIPNLVLMAPKNGQELTAMLKFAVSYNGPIALKYARGSVFDGLLECQAPIKLGKSEWISDGEDAVILSVGNMMEESLKTKEILEEKGVDAALVNVRFLSPFDHELFHELARRFPYIITVEDNIITGGFGQMVSGFLHRYQYQNDLLTFGIPDCFVEHATVKEQRQDLGIDADTMAQKILQRMGR